MTDLELLLSYNRSMSVSARFVEGRGVHFAVFNGLFLEAILFENRANLMDAASAVGLDMWLDWLGIKRRKQTDEE